MKYIRIKNKGHIEPKALSLMGASTKAGDNTKIGQFGSGNKYAIAYFLRNGHEVRVFSGLEEIKIETKRETFRNSDFNVIYINGIPTSITTQMGKDWQFWQAMREIYCNALDEGEASFDFVNHIEPKNDETHFYITANSQAYEFVSNFDNYFSTNKKVLFECSVGKILEKTGDVANIYRKGIRCVETKANSIYDYDFHDIPIDENRLVKYSFQVDEYIWKLIVRCNDKVIIKKIMTNLQDNRYREANITDYSNINFDVNDFSKEFLEFISETKLAPFGLSGLLTTEELAETCIIPTKIFTAIRPYVNEENISNKFKISNKGKAYKITEPNPLQKKIIDDAMYFLSEARFEIPYEIKFGICDDKRVMGLADHKEQTIIITDIGTENGISQVVSTIIEEYIHLKHKVNDETRSFQNAVINEFVSYMKKTNSFAI